MVTLPIDFVATKYPGYFWNIPEQKLYSVKVTGMLKPLVRQYANQFNHFTDGYQVSVRGNKRTMRLEYLKSLTYSVSVIPIYQEEIK